MRSVFSSGQVINQQVTSYDVAFFVAFGCYDIISGTLII